MLHDQLHRQVHVWFTCPEQASDPHRLDQYRGILSAEETARCRRFRFPADSHRYLISHALLRITLSKYADLAPSQWTFTHGAHGRPEISNPGAKAIRFNLTHTAGLVGCLVALEDDCGIDVEAVAGRHDLVAVAKRMFSADEYDELQQLRGSQRRDYFFRCWTLREAYVKALGVGLSFPTRKLSFTTDLGGVVQVSFEPELGDDSRQWQFRLLRPTPEHIAAIAVRRHGERDKQVIVHDAKL